MDKQNVLYTHKGMLFSPKKEGNPVTQWNIDELEDSNLSKLSLSYKNQTDRASWYTSAIQEVKAGSSQVQGHPRHSW
jgi:hypothetical protein